MKSFESKRFMPFSTEMTRLSDFHVYDYRLCHDLHRAANASTSETALETASRQNSGSSKRTPRWRSASSSTVMTAVSRSRASYRSANASPSLAATAASPC